MAARSAAAATPAARRFAALRCPAVSRSAIFWSAASVPRSAVSRPSTVRGPPPYDAQPYGSPAAGGYGAARRPGTVIAAAVIAFVYSGLIILLYLLALLMLTGRIDYATRHLGATLLGVIYMFLLIRLAVGALFTWGGVCALRGRGRTLLVVSVIELVLAFGGLAIRLAGTHRVTSHIGGSGFVGVVLDVAFVAPILILILLPSSTNFFRRRNLFFRSDDLGLAWIRTCRLRLSR